MCRKAQVTLIELNKYTREIRAKHQNKAQNHKSSRVPVMLDSASDSLASVSEAGVSKDRSVVFQSCLASLHSWNLEFRTTSQVQRQNECNLKVSNRHNGRIL